MPQFTTKDEFASLSVGRFLNATGIEPKALRLTHRGIAIQPKAKSDAGNDSEDCFSTITVALLDADLASKVQSQLRLPLRLTFENYSIDLATCRIGKTHSRSLKFKFPCDRVRR